jgi:hypothetical protein
MSGNYEVYRMFTWKGYPKDIDWDNIDVMSLIIRGIDRKQFYMQSAFVQI